MIKNIYIYLCIHKYISISISIYVNGYIYLYSYIGGKKGDELFDIEIIRIALSLVKSKFPSPLLRIFIYVYLYTHIC
jgi:hypothetical protein